MNIEKNKKLNKGPKKIIPNKLKANGGFTLLELLMASSIIIIISVITVANIKVGSNEQALLRSAQKFAFDIRKVQNLALSPQRIGVNPVCFYGVSLINNLSYRLYYRDSDNCAGIVPAQRRFNAQAEVLEVVFLEPGIQFVPPINHDFAFMPPEPIVLYRANENFVDRAVVLRIGGVGGDTRTITINKFGNLEIQ